jgi:hypothetical protein
MKGRILSALLGILLGASAGVWAGDRSGADRPDHYVDPRLLQDQLERLRKSPKVTMEDLDNLSRQIHNVSVLSAPVSRADIIPAATRPTGTVKLKAVLQTDLKN